ncbi:MAG: outer membrane beta-barrel protein [Bacteroidales bacterium]
MKSLAIHLFLVVSVTTMAQNSSVNGLVQDAMNGEPMEFASVAIYHTSDSSLVTGTVTDTSGHFQINKLPHGDFFIRTQFLGYEINQSENFTLDARQDMSLGIIPLEPSSQLVEEVTVTGTRINAMNKLDRQSYQADQFESAKGGSAVDVLKNMPSVALNGLGEITVRGSTGFLVLINGKPVLTDAQTALGQLPANMINSVELITSPSAKYDPDGKAGIINITTKKGATNGSGLQLNAGYGLPSTTDFGNDRVALRHSVEVLYNYRKNNWDLSVGGNYNRNDLAGYREGDAYTENVADNKMTRFPSEGERSFNRYNYAARAAITYTVNPNNTISMGIFSGKRYQERDANLFYTNSTWTLDGQVKIADNPYYNANKQIKQGTFTLGNVDYTHLFANKGSLTASFLYEYDNLHGTTHNRNLTEPGGSLIQYVQNPYQKPINGYRFRLDYSVPLGNGTLESGYQFRYDSQDGIFDYLITPEDPGQPDLDKFRGTALSINQIHSVYSQFSESHEKLEYVVGLRYEYAKRTVDLSIDPITHVLNLSNLFPSASLLYSIHPGLSIKAGFSRRIQRSTNNQLNPIPEREHSETLEIGDPDLLPEFINLAEIGITKKFEKGGSVFVTAYYRAGKNPVQRVNSVYADSILNRVYTNVEKGNAVGFESVADLHPARWWALYLGLNVYNQMYHGELKILDGPPVQIENSGWVYSINTNTTFYITPSFSIQANVNYLSKRPTAQGEDSRYLIPNLSVKKSFFDNRLTASIQWQNIDLGMHQTNRQRITTWGEDFYTTTNYIYETDVVMLNLSYNINFNKSNAKLPSSEFGEKEF